MKHGIIILLLILSYSNIFGQNNDRTYLYRGDNFNTTYCYSVVELTIHSDLTYTSKSYCMSNKNAWENYKKALPEIHNGKITLSGKFYEMTEYRNGNKTDFESQKIKITDKNVFLYYPNRNGKLKRTAKYKQI